MKCENGSERKLVNLLFKRSSPKKLVNMQHNLCNFYKIFDTSEVNHDIKSKKKHLFVLNYVTVAYLPDIDIKYEFLVSINARL